jgi:hypothetical protein
MALSALPLAFLEEGLYGALLKDNEFPISISLLLVQPHEESDQEPKERAESQVHSVVDDEIRAAGISGNQLGRMNDSQNNGGKDNDKED